MKSIGTSPYTTVAALKAADKLLGANRVWSGQDKVQKTWVKETYVPCSAELANIKEIDSNATTEIENHVAFMRKHGWEPQIKAAEPGQLLTVGVLDLLVAWTKPGHKVPLKVDGVGEFPGVRLSNSVVNMFANKQNDAVARLSTKSGDQVWIALCDKAPKDTREVMQVVHRSFDDLRGELYAFKGIIFPMVDLASKQSLDWICGLSTTKKGSGRGYEVAQALQQATLKMNDEGARARAADEMTIEATSVARPKPPFVVDRPFVVAFKRQGLTQPLYAAYVGHESWKDPGGLGV